MIGSGWDLLVLELFVWDRVTDIIGACACGPIRCLGKSLSVDIFVFSREVVPVSRTLVITISFGHLFPKAKCTCRIVKCFIVGMISTRSKTFSHRTEAKSLKSRRFLRTAWSAYLGTGAQLNLQHQQGDLNSGPFRNGSRPSLATTLVPMCSHVCAWHEDTIGSWCWFFRFFVDFLVLYAHFGTVLGPFRHSHCYQCVRTIFLEPLTRKSKIFFWYFFSNLALIWQKRN